MTGQHNIQAWSTASTSGMRSKEGEATWIRRNSQTDRIQRVQYVVGCMGKDDDVTGNFYEENKNPEDLKEQHATMNDNNNA